VTVKDTQTIYAALIDPELCAYPNDKEHIRVLNNKEATRQGILDGLTNLPGDTEVKVSNLMNHLSKAVPESALRLHSAEQTPHFDMDAGDFVIAKLRGGKGLPDKGWEEVQPQATQKINQIAQNIQQYGRYITNINEVRDVQNFHIGDVIHNS
jgi:hypothetical protein